MSLHPQVLCPIPEETARVARAASPKGNLSLRIRDELATLSEDERFADLFPRCGQSAEAPWRLVLVCLMQFAEGLICSASSRCRSWAGGLERSAQS
jgi:transposase